MRCGVEACAAMAAPMAARQHTLARMHLLCVRFCAQVRSRCDALRRTPDDG